MFPRLPLLHTGRRRKALIAIVTAAILLVGWWATSVDDSITEQDREAIGALVRGCSLDSTTNITFVRSVQLCVLARVVQRELPPGSLHEPQYVIRAGGGECYDRARIIEKTLRINGLRTRHVAQYDLDTVGLLGLVRRGTPSHAALDVFIDGKWMSVGTVNAFLGLTSGGELVPTSLVSRLKSPTWKYEAPPAITAAKNVTIYGLWSRHGRFFPPFVPAPDIAWREFASNLWAQ
jgi:hypothetical protein